MKIIKNADKVNTSSAYLMTGKQFYAVTLVADTLQNLINVDESLSTIGSNLQNMLDETVEINSVQRKEIAALIEEFLEPGE